MASCPLWSTEVLKRVEKRWLDLLHSRGINIEALLTQVEQCRTPHPSRGGRSKTKRRTRAAERSGAAKRSGIANQSGIAKQNGGTSPRSTTKRRVRSTTYAISWLVTFCFLAFVVCLFVEFFYKEKWNRNQDMYFNGLNQIKDGFCKVTPPPIIQRFLNVTIETFAHEDTIKKLRQHTAADPSTLEQLASPAWTFFGNLFGLSNYTQKFTEKLIVGVARDQAPVPIPDNPVCQIWKDYTLHNFTYLLQFVYNGILSHYQYMFTLVGNPVDQLYRASNYGYRNYKLYKARGTSYIKEGLKQSIPAPIRFVYNIPSLSRAAATMSSDVAGYITDYLVDLYYDWQRKGADPKALEAIFAHPPKALIANINEEKRVIPALPAIASTRSQPTRRTSPARSRSKSPARTRKSVAQQIINEMQMPQ